MKNKFRFNLIAAVMVCYFILGLVGVFVYSNDNMEMKVVSIVGLISGAMYIAHRWARK